MSNNKKKTLKRRNKQAKKKKKQAIEISAANNKINNKKLNVKQEKTNKVVIIKQVIFSVFWTLLCICLPILGIIMSIYKIIHKKIKDSVEYFACSAIGITFWYYIFTYYILN